MATRGGGAAPCGLGGRWVVVSPDLYAMARVQFCVYEARIIVPTPLSVTMVCSLKVSASLSASDAILERVMQMPLPLQSFGQTERSHAAPV